MAVKKDSSQPPETNRCTTIMALQSQQTAKTSRSPNSMMVSHRRSSFVSWSLFVSVVVYCLLLSSVSVSGKRFDCQMFCKTTGFHGMVGGCRCSFTLFTSKRSGGGMAPGAQSLDSFWNSRSLIPFSKPPVNWIPRADDIRLEQPSHLLDAFNQQHNNQMLINEIRDYVDPMIARPIRQMNSPFQRFGLNPDINNDNMLDWHPSLKRSAVDSESNPDSGSSSAPGSSAAGGEEASQQGLQQQQKPAYPFLNPRE